jgi:2-polyprenyl-6-methoxyphenol hydroxylase-like FAD-dependent oxidoreductase
MNAIPARDLHGVVIGAGPVGLAAAARLVERGLRHAVFEKGGRAGAAILDWGHVRVFSPRNYEENGEAGCRRSGRPAAPVVAIVKVGACCRSAP